METIKNFYANNKMTVIIGGCVAASVAAYFFIFKGKKTKTVR